MIENEYMQESLKEKYPVEKTKKGKKKMRDEMYNSLKYEE
jgi:hypothetical protein